MPSEPMSLLLVTVASPCADILVCYLLQLKPYVAHENKIVEPKK